MMGYDEETARGVFAETFGFGWVDRQTRALLLEFAVFNANTNLLSVATYLYEVLASGAAFTTRKVDTLELYSRESGALMFYLICQFLFIAMVLNYLIMLLVHLYRQRLRFFKSVWNVVDFSMILFSVLSVAFYMIKSKSILKSVKDIQDNPYEIVHFHTALIWADWENTAIALAIFMVTFKLLNLIRFNSHVIFLFSSLRQSISCQLSFVILLLIMFNAFAISGKQLFGHAVLGYSSYLRAVVSQFEFILGKAILLSDLRNQNPFLGSLFAFLYNTTMTIVMINMLVSVLNESYIDAKSHAEGSAKDLEMARFIGEQFMGMFNKGDNRSDFKLYCDDSTFTNMCLSEAEPFCINSESIVQCTDERLEKLEKRIAALTSRTKYIDVHNEQEEDEFQCLLTSVIQNS